MYYRVILLFILFELLPSSLEDTSRRKRQIVFPGGPGDDDYDYGERPVTTPCITPDRRQGNCIRVTSCPVLLQMNYNRLRRFFCGFHGEEPRVCCPISGSSGQPSRTPRPPTRRTTPPTRRTTPSTRRTTPSTRRTTQATRRTTVTRPGLGGSASIQGHRAQNSYNYTGCGQSKNILLTRVVGGQEAEKGSWPWMAVVYQLKRGAKSPECGGALVTNQHVVTAAHCVVARRAVPLKPEVLSIRLGEHDLYSNNDEMNPIDLNVISVIRHENFDPRTYANDIAVLKLERPVQFTKNISPICLPFDSMKDVDLTGRKAFVAGWGTTSFNGPSSPVLMQAQFEIQSQELCRNAYRAELPITDVYICAGTLDGKKDSCQGDSGGPLMSVGVNSAENSKKPFYLVGVVSFGKLCATPGYPGVYTRVTKYLNWLRTNLT